MSPWPAAVTRISVIHVQAVGGSLGDPGQGTVPTILKCCCVLILTQNMALALLPLLREGDSPGKPPG